MRIISVVTLISPLGEYGGPTRVALNQAAALRARGHDVVVAAATRGFDEVPTSISDVPVKLFPARQALPGAGFAGLSSPGLWRWVRREARSVDVLHVHGARDLVTLPAARLAHLARVPYFLQSHGMIDPSSHPLARPVDAVLTRPVLRAAEAVFHLTALERDQLTEVSRGAARLLPLHNGVPAAEAGPPATDDVEVLYLARLAPRKRPLSFVEAAVALHAEHPGVRFSLVGPDEGEGAKVARAIELAQRQGVQIQWEGALSPGQTLDRLRHATVYVLPSVDEPYPMSVLEAMSVARPVVITDTCGLSGVVTEAGAGHVTDSTTGSLVSAIGQLLKDPDESAAMGRRGRAFVLEQMSMDSIAETLEGHYASAIA